METFQYDHNLTYTQHITHKIRHNIIPPITTSGILILHNDVIEANYRVHELLIKIRTMLYNKCGLSCKILHCYHNHHRNHNDKIPLPPSDEINIMSSPSITSSSSFIPPLPDDEYDSENPYDDDNSDDRQYTHINVRHDHRNNKNKNNSHHDDDDDDDVNRTLMTIASDIVTALREQPIYIIKIMMMIITTKKKSKMIMIPMMNINDNHDHNNNDDDNDILQNNISSNLMIEIAFITMHRILHPFSTDPSLTTSLLIEAIHQQYNEIHSIYSIFNASDSAFLASRALLIWDPKIALLWDPLKV